MEQFKQYRRKENAELRPVTQQDINEFQSTGGITVSLKNRLTTKVSVSDADRQNGSPKIGDMIARNPKNHVDQWLVAKQYFQDNFEEPVLEEEKTVWLASGTDEEYKEKVHYIASLTGSLHLFSSIYGKDSDTAIALAMKINGLIEEL